MALAPLVLPAADAYGDWVAERCAEHLALVPELVARITTGEHDAGEVLALWNDVGIAFANVFAVASLFANVHPDEDVRDRAEAAEADAHRLMTDVSLDRALYDVLAAVDASGLDAAARRVLERSLRDFTRAGVDRDEPTRERLRAQSERETAVGQAFSKGVRDGVRSIRVAPERLAGLPEDFLDDHPAADDGLVTLTTDYPDYVPVMTFCADRDVRRELAAAFLNRAWPENDAVLHELLELRRERAGLLGYPDWPTYDAEVKMIGSADPDPASAGQPIAEFIDRISALAAPSSDRDLRVVLDRLRQDHPDAADIGTPDKAYYTELVRREQYDVDAQEVRRYFDFTRVRAGLLEVTGRLFGLEYVEVPDALQWHEDVAVYDVRQDGELLGRIHLDLHPRAGKYSHAAQFDLVSGVAGRQLPEGVLVCNFGRGLLDHDDVVTLFHEFGHLLHHVLGGRHPWVRFSGVATEWDFVEAPSQMLEEWAWDHDVLATFAIDAAGAPIPADLVARMRAADEFGKGFDVRVQMFYAAVSYYLHLEVPDDLTARVRELQLAHSPFAPLEDTHFHASFTHLGGYSSAYYTYAWSQVIAKDLFSAFDPEAMFAREVAARYRDTILVPGGSKDAADLVADFLGRPYSFDAYRDWLADA